MSVNITMPALSPTMEEGTLAKWLVKVGDNVSAGDVIAEIETDKATMEVEAVDEGTIAKLLVDAGTEGVKVNAVIAVLAEEGEDADSVTVDEGGPPASSSTTATAEQTSGSAEDVTASPAPSPATATKGSSKEQSAETVAKKAGDRIFATPLARRLAEQKGVDLSTVSGSGPRGRIVKSDIENAQAGSGAGASDVASASRTMATGPDDATVLGLFEEGSFERKPHDGMRRVIAQRLTESAQTIPSYFVTMECRLDALLELRSAMNAAAPQNEDGKPEYKISVNDFIVKAMAMALMRVPTANVSWTSTDRLYHAHADVGVAVAVEDGLYTPIVRKADTKSLSKISAEIKDMAGRARSKRLAPEEYQGGCTAVSNLGMFGVREFTSIINPPHASIVSIGAGEKKPIVVGDEIVVGTMMAATFAFDHRAIDGALGAELAAAFKMYVEQPAAMLA